ncbi:MAG: hypothetical protein LBJ58_05560 [Tannerellaceae bacterium]|jgi:hypothetical protein|nr:hypothetical protein [Tannerellaceae bacterium]
MNKITLLITSLAALFSACNPIETKYSIGRDYNVDELDISVKAVVVDGKNTNKLIFENHSPILGEWDYSFGITGQQVTDTAIIVVEGPLDVTFKGLNPSGTTITKNFVVNIEVLHFPVPPEWALLCGDGTKVWEWEVDEVEDGPFGAGGYRDTHEPWDPTDLDDLDGGWWEQPGWGEGATMTFSIRGAAFSKTDATHSKTEYGTFTFDMSQKLTNLWEPDEIWSHGKLRIYGGTSILAGRVPHYDEWYIYDVYEFDIVELSEDRLVLAYWLEPREWCEEAYFWIFRPSDKHVGEY